MMKKFEFHTLFNTLKTLLISKSLCFCCLHKLSEKSGSKNILRCRKKGCNKTYNVLEGPFIETKVEIAAIVDILYFYISGYTTKQIELQLNVHRNNIRAIFKKFDIILKNLKKEQRSKIGGDGIIVEVDESKFGKIKYNRGRMVDGVWILGGIERTPEKKCFFEVLRFRNKESLNTLIKNNIKINTHVYTDMWKGYFDLGQIGYIHKTVNHSREFVNRENGAIQMQ